MIWMVLKNLKKSLELNGIQMIYGFSENLSQELEIWLKMHVKMAQMDYPISSSCELTYLELWPCSFIETWM